MKKLMMALAVAALAVAANAATFNWAISNVYTPTGSNLSPNKNNSTLIGSGDAVATLYWSADGISWSEVASAKNYEFDKDGGFNSVAAFSADSMPDGMAKGKNYFKAIVSYSDASYEYSVELYSGTKTSAQQVDLTNIDNNTTSVTFQGVTGATTGRTWTATPIPEPTSALMLLLGMAGLALRRRHA